MSNTQSTYRPRFFGDTEDRRRGEILRGQMLHAHSMCLGGRKILTECMVRPASMSDRDLTLLSAEVRLRAAEGGEVWLLELCEAETERRLAAALAGIGTVDMEGAA